jgi:hypothetical protein
LIENPTHRHALEEKIAKTSLRTWDNVTDDIITALTKK